MFGKVEMSHRHSRQKNKQERRHKGRKEHHVLGGGEKRGPGKQHIGHQWWEEELVSIRLYYANTWLIYIYLLTIHLSHWSVSSMKAENLISPALRALSSTQQGSESTR